MEASSTRMLRVDLMVLRRAGASLTRKRSISSPLHCTLESDRPLHLALQA